MPGGGADALLWTPWALCALGAHTQAKHTYIYINLEKHQGHGWWHTPLTPALCELKASLVYVTQGGTAQCRSSRPFLRPVLFLPLPRTFLLRLHVTDFPLDSTGRTLLQMCLLFLLYPTLQLHFIVFLLELLLSACVGCELQGNMRFICSDHPWALCTQSRALSIVGAQ